MSCKPVLIYSISKELRVGVLRGSVKIIKKTGELIKGLNKELLDPQVPCLNQYILVLYM